MRAIVTKSGGFKGKDNHSPRCLHYAEGAEINGSIAQTAVRENWARPIDDDGEAESVAKPKDDPPKDAPAAEGKRTRAPAKQ